jgi:hypothetical protein
MNPDDAAAEDEVAHADEPATTETE